MLFFPLADQLNTTVHGTMKTTPYELVFGQPPRHNIFPGVTNPNVMEEDIEDILEEEEEVEEEDGQKVDEDDNKQKDTMEGERERDDSDGSDKDKAKDDKNDDKRCQRRGWETPSVYHSQAPQPTRRSGQALPPQCRENAAKILQSKKKEGPDLFSWWSGECPDTMNWQDVYRLPQAGVCGGWASGDKIPSLQAEVLYLSLHVPAI